MAKKNEPVDESLTAYILQNAEKKKKTPGEWWTATVQNVEKCRLASHVGKFTHPDSPVALLADPGAPDVGYVTTQGCQCRDDVLTPAQYMGTASLLLKLQADGRNLLEWIDTSPESVENELTDMGLSEPSLIDAVKSLEERSRTVPTQTDERLKQVYFPVSGTFQYHLLTVLPASSLLLTLKGRLRQMIEQRRLCYARGGNDYGGDCEDIPDLTEVGFGGTKPQNISALNFRAGGTGYLLPSLPPVWSDRGIHPPKKDFFRETMPYRDVRQSFFTLHALFALERNTIDIRERIREEITAMAEVATAEAAAIRKEVPGGWSSDDSHDALPASQKIWLDEGLQDRRLESDAWIDNIGTDFARWLIREYERVIGREKVILGDAELRFFKNRMTEILKEEVRMDK